jgi:transcription antitermination factor NusG
MAVLLAEPTLFPAGLFEDGSNHAAAEGRSWCVAHTRPRQEKCLGRAMLDSQSPFFLPVMEKHWVLRGRRMTSHIPVFSGYMFLLATQPERDAAKRTNRVAQLLEVPDQRQLWDELARLNRLIESGEPIDPEACLRPGVDVEIISGLLQGLVGRIEKTASGRRFVVAVNFIGRGASILLPDHVLITRRA